MQISFAPMVGVFGVSAWDIVQNHGALSRAVFEAFVHFGHSLGAF